MVQGRKPNLKRRQQVTALRARGLSLLAIAQIIGVSRQCVQQTLRRMSEPPAVRSVTCCRCGRRIISAGALRRDQGRALCLPCLHNSPHAPFGQRLKALRLAAGLTQGELAARVGVTPSCLCVYEACQKEPKRSTLDRLIDGLSAKPGGPVAHSLGKRRSRKQRQVDGCQLSACRQILLGR
jgi:transcriptional regulator with XRE-family HTH domain